MTQSDPSMPTAPRHARRLILLMLLRLTLSVSLLVVAYYLIPTVNARGGSDVPWLILELCVFGVIVGVQVPAIVKAKYPVLRAVEAMGMLVPLYLLIFARIYLWNSFNDPAAFTRLLDHTTALYFTVTVFATVGFGDIVAQTNNMRLLVTVQMLLNLVILGLVIKLLTSAARRGVARRGQQPDPAEENRGNDW
jgi:voltage-gated potassium channel